MDYVEAKTAWVLGQKALTDLKVAEKSGKLTDAELVAREVEQIFRELCQRFRTVADRLPFDHQQRESLLREMDSIQGEYARELGID